MEEFEQQSLKLAGLVYTALLFVASVITKLESTLGSMSGQNAQTYSSCGGLCGYLIIHRSLSLSFSTLVHLLNILSPTHLSTFHPPPLHPPLPNPYFSPPTSHPPHPPSFLDHNKTHAADVLHGVSYLLFEMIPEFYHEFPHGELSSSQRIWKGYQRSKGSGGNIASAFSILEVFACYMAAAMHDYDHPGRTNAFLVGTNSPLVRHFYLLCLFSPLLLLPSLYLSLPSTVFLCLTPPLSLPHFSSSYMYVFSLPTALPLFPLSPSSASPHSSYHELPS